MQSLKNIVELISKQKEILRSKYNLKEIGIFGSYTRNEQNAKSDVDILVDFTEVPGLFKFIELENYLSDMIGVKVDLVLKNTLKPNIAKQVFSEVITL